MDGEARMAAGTETKEPVTFTMRAATRSDVSFLWRLTALTMREYVAAIWGWDESWQEARFRRQFNPSRWQIIVVDGEDAGGLAVDHLPRELFLADLQILPEYQRRGIGTALIRALIATARNMGLPLTLNVLRSNPGARRLYERLGFVVVPQSQSSDQILMMAAGETLRAGETHG